VDVTFRVALCRRVNVALADLAGHKDLVDEAVYYFRSNVFFSSFEMKGPADRVLVYLTVFMQLCLVRAVDEGRRGQPAVMTALNALAAATPAVSGEAGFLVPGPFYTAPAEAEREDLRAYLKQLRAALVPRLVEIIFDESGDVSKWWKQFAKLKFMQISTR